MASGDTIIRFDDVTFLYDLKVILDEATFNVREGQKMTIMGQNGSGKTTMFKMIMGEIRPKHGKINIDKNLRIAVSHQVMREDDKGLSVQKFFRKYFADDTIYNIDARIAEVLAVVNLVAPLDRLVSEFSG